MMHTIKPTQSQTQHIKIELKRALLHVKNNFFSFLSLIDSLPTSAEILKTKFYTKFVLKRASTCLSKFLRRNKK